MYIAEKQFMGTTRFYIRESYLEKGVYRHRDLMELGPDPRRLIIYLYGRSFMIDPVVEERLTEKVDSIDYDELESIFWPYIRPDIKRRYEGARSREKEAKTPEPYLENHHEFDKRRLIFLKAGGMNQGKIETISEHYFRILDGKSRDEIEHRFMRMEQGLKPKEIKSYVYVSFDLQKHFKAFFAREMPQALDQEKIADSFIEEICRINRDKTLWPETGNDPFLNDYLKRYVIMFFDSPFDKSTFLEDREFAEFNRRRFRWMRQRPVEDVYSDASELFGVPADELKKMTKRKLKKLFRQKAQELHPDKGGDHDTFVNFSNIYDELMNRKQN